MKELVNRIVQCGDLVFNRRISLSRYSIEHLSERLERIDDRLRDLANGIGQLATKLPTGRGFLAEIGFEVLKVIIVAAFVLAMIKGLDAAALIAFAGAR